MRKSRYSFILALLFCGAAAWFGMDHQRVSCPAVVMAVASYYLAFAAVDGRIGVMLSEVAIALGGAAAPTPPIPEGRGDRMTLGQRLMSNPL